MMGEVVAGVDIGSLTAKTVIMAKDERGGKILSYRIIQRGIVDESAARESLEDAIEMAGIRKEDIGFIVTTGYGRSLVQFGNKNITEITCHAKGADFLFKGAKTVIDIGGQDSKVISLDGNGRVINFAMNDKCAAGTGRFLEVMANALGIALNEMGPLSLNSKNPSKVSSLCTVFAESEVISLVARGESKVDIISGIHEAIGRRMLTLTKVVGVFPPVVMTGGVAKNAGVVRVLERLLGLEINLPSEPQIVGALGAALLALDEIKRSVS
jgi:predicted CoA-substrate-specific enzyme activase